MLSPRDAEQEIGVLGFVSEVDRNKPVLSMSKGRFELS
jgi:hypothetical protein